MSELPERLDLSQPEDLSLFVSLVPNWFDLVLDLDFDLPEHQEMFTARVQRAWDDAVADLARRADERRS